MLITYYIIYTIDNKLVDNMENQFDVCVLGGGPGGYVAAIRASQLGAKVVLVEKDKLGGTCLNWGCIPTKALLESASLYRKVKNLAEYGLKADNISFDSKQIVDYSRRSASKLSNGIGFLMQKNNITIVHGIGSIQKNGQIFVDIEKNGKKSLIKSKNIIIATGGRFKPLPNINVESEKILTYKEAMVQTTFPKSLTIIGGGPIGVEFASFYNTFGTNITLIESQKYLLPSSDHDVSTAMHNSLASQGIKILNNAKVQEISTKHNQVQTVLIDDDGKQRYNMSDLVLVAIGSKPNIENIGIENIKLELHNGYIKTNSNMQTNEPNIYAIGDVTAPPWLAHKASFEGIIAAEHIMGLKTRPLFVNNIPSCVYSYPQVASVGLTEIQAKQQGYNIRVGKFPLNANGKAIVQNPNSIGFVKTIFDCDTNELLGAHMIGDNVTELIHGYTVAKSGELTSHELIHTVFPHPTLSESMHESVLKAYNQAVHIGNK